MKCCFNSNDRRKNILRRACEISLLAGVALAIVFSVSVSGFSSSCKQVRSSVLRLHVIANSDSGEDQALKLKVRDAVLEAGSEVFGVSSDVESAEKLISENTEMLKFAAEKAVVDNGYQYGVTVSVCEDWFPTKTYGSYTLPAGTYSAVKVIIGEGEGHNWWCVMFPPLCLPAAENSIDLDDVLSKDGQRVVTVSPRYEIRFKVVEWIEKLRDGDN